MKEISAAWKTARGKTLWRSVEAAKKKVKDDQFYLIRRHGAFFRPDGRGYTIELSAAGIYNGATARSYLDVDNLSVIPLKSAKKQISQTLRLFEDQVRNLREMEEMANL